MKIKNKQRILIVIIIIELIALICLGALYVSTHDVFIPSFAQWNKCDNDYILNGETVNFKVKSRKLTIRDDEENVLYRTEKGVYVSDAFCIDIDRDGEQEICLLTWKRGSYGEHKPFWVSEDTDRWTQHIFLYEWDSARNDRLDPKWMSSEIGIKVVKIFGDEECKLHLIDTEGNETICSWEGWGLTIE